MAIDTDCNSIGSIGLSIHCILCIIRIIPYLISGQIQIIGVHAIIFVQVSVIWIGGCAIIIKHCHFLICRGIYQRNGIYICSSFSSKQNRHFLGTYHKPFGTEIQCNIGCNAGRHLVQIFDSNVQITRHIRKSTDALTLIGIPMLFRIIVHRVFFYISLCNQLIKQCVCHLLSGFLICILKCCIAGQYTYLLCNFCHSFGISIRYRIINYNGKGFCGRNRTVSICQTSIIGIRTNCRILKRQHRRPGPVIFQVVSANIKVAVIQHFCCHFVCFGINQFHIISKIF